MNSRELSTLIGKPYLLHRFLLTGKLEVLSRPSSPLITLLSSFKPGELRQIRTLRVDAALGYRGNRVFCTAQAALNWLRPEYERPPSESWQDRRFKRVLAVDDLFELATVPESVACAWRNRNAHKMGRCN
jgi:hypothetical protein